jgi:hypothetical protein
MICGNIGNYAASMKVMPRLDVVDPSPDFESLVSFVDDIR